MYIKKGDLFLTEGTEAIEIFNPFGGHSMGMRAPSFWYEKYYHDKFLGSKKLKISPDDLLVASEGYASIGGWSVFGRMMENDTPVHFQQYRAEPIFLGEEITPEDDEHFSKLIMVKDGYGHEMLKELREKIDGIDVIDQAVLNDLERSFFAPCIYASIWSRMVYDVIEKNLQKIKEVLGGNAPQKELSKLTERLKILKKSLV